MMPRVRGGVRCLHPTLRRGMQGSAAEGGEGEAEEEEGGGSGFGDGDGEGLEGLAVGLSDGVDL